MVYYKELKIEECKKYFIRAFSKFIDLKNISIQNKFRHIIETRGNLFSFLKFLIFFYPKFNFINQPNLISKEELIEIVSQANILLIIINKEQKESELCKVYKNLGKNQETKEHCKDDNQRGNEYKEKINYDEDFNEIEYKKYFTQKQIQNINEYIINAEETSKYKNFGYNIKEQILSENKKTEYNDNNEEIEHNDSKTFFNDLSDLFEIIIKESNFMDEMNRIIEMINKILYKPPYDILFGRISIAKPKPNPPENVNQNFYDGFDAK